MNINQKLSLLILALLLTHDLIGGLFSLVKCTTDRNKFSGYDDSDAYDERDHENLEKSYSMDVAIKLKREFSDELVSDLFATSYGIEKVARISDLDHENSLFHFKFTNIPYESDDMIPMQYSTNTNNSTTSRKKRRSKRHIYDKVDVLRSDDRVEFVLPQHYIFRHKRTLDTINDYNQLEKFLIENLKSSRKSHRSFKHQKSKFDTESVENNLNNMANQVNKEMEKRKNMQHYFAHYEKHLKNLTNWSSRSYKLPDEINFNDENFAQQWYLIDDGQFKIPLLNDLNVKNAWLSGFTGKNITIVIIDDGLDYEHPDFQGKYRADLSYDYNDLNDSLHDPMPATFDSQNNHGTRCAGAAAANANNSVCGVGVAFNAQIAGIRILDGPITDLLEAQALSYKAKDVDIRSASWGPKDDGMHMEYPGKLVNLALEEGVKNGRNGKGTLFVWASGNGGGNDDDCSCDGYVSHWNIISIGSVNHRGMKPYFMELCPSTFAVVYSGGQTKVRGDLDDPGVRVIASDVRGKCTKTFQGTSSAAPLAAGALALVLEANPELTYRDVMHLIARTSRIPNVEDTNGWILNGAGYHLNEKFGFGVMDVSHMLHVAQTWENVLPREKCVVHYNKDLIKLSGQENITLILEVNPKDCPKIDQLEHVVANISFSYTSRGDVKLTLISPSETSSEILSFRKNDRSNKGATYFPFMTLFNWGESPIGKWQLKIETRTREQEKSKIDATSTSETSENKPIQNEGKLEHFSLVLYGTPATKQAANKSSRKRFADKVAHKAIKPSSEQIATIYESEIRVSRQARIISKKILDEQNLEIRNLLDNIDDIQV